MNKLWFLGGFFALALVLVVFSVVNAAGQSQQPAPATLNNGGSTVQTSCGCGADAPCGGQCGANGGACQCGGACRMNRNVVQPQ